MKASPSSGSIARQSAGAAAWQSAEKVNAELFTLTYGALVRQLLNDSEDSVEDVNAQLDKLGYNIGTRLVDEFFAKTGTGRCTDFRDACDALSKVAFRMFLGVTATATNWAPDGTACTLVLSDNPLADYVEVPEQYSGLSYCNLLCGVVRGAMECASWRVTCTWERDPLQSGAASGPGSSAAVNAGAVGVSGAGTPPTGEAAGLWAMRITLLEHIAEHYPFDE